MQMEIFEKNNERSIIILIVECIKRYETVATYVVKFGNKYRLPVIYH